MKRRTLLENIPDGAIDLGLPSHTLWGQGNIVKDGSKYKIGSETDYGAYVSWGNIDPHFSTNGSTWDDGYDWDTSFAKYDKTSGGKLTTDIPVNATYDAARALLGSPWRLPTNEECTELVNSTDNEWTTINGINGYKLMKKSDHSIYIFLPAGGFGHSTGFPYNGKRGDMGGYWSSTKVPEVTNSAWCITFRKTPEINPNYGGHRYCGRIVRPVCKV